MKKSTEELVYKHITKLPWIGLAIWSTLMTWAFGLLQLETYFSNVMRHFLFGLSCIFLWFFLDDRTAARFRRRVLLSTPGLREATIQNILEEAGVYAAETSSDDGEY
jgi:hypothetical protein